MAIMEGADPVERLRTSFAPSYKANLMIWPFVQGVNFSVVPLDYRVLFVNFVALGELSQPSLSGFGPFWEGFRRREREVVGLG